MGIKSITLHLDTTSPCIRARAFRSPFFRLGQNYWSIEKGKDFFYKQLPIRKCASEFACSIASHWFLDRSRLSDAIASILRTSSPFYRDMVCIWGMNPPSTINAIAILAEYYGRIDWSLWQFHWQENRATSYDAKHPHASRRLEGWTSSRRLSGVDCAHAT